MIFDNSTFLINFDNYDEECVFNEFLEIKPEITRNNQLYQNGFLVINTVINFNEQNYSDMTLELRLTDLLPEVSGQR